MKPNINFNNYIFPKTLGNFRLKKTLRDIKHMGNYALAMYSDPNGKHVLVKRWEGKHKDLKFKWLNNEIRIYQMINQLKMRSKISIPKLIKVINEKNFLYLVIEFIKGRDISGLSVEKKSSIFLDTIDYLTKAGKQTNKLYSFKIAQRGPLFWLSILPFIALLSIYKYPRYFRPILLSCFYVLLSGINLIRRKERVLVHRDLNDNNVIVSNEKIYVIDFELACFADPLLDYAILFVKNSPNTKFIEAIKNKAQVRKYMDNPKTQRALVSYMLILSIYDLCFETGLHNASIIVLNQFVKNGFLL